MGCGSSSSFGSRIVNEKAPKNYSKGKFSFISVLGTGASCSVHKVQDKGTDIKYALKVLSKRAVEFRPLEMWRQEVDILKPLKHKNVIEFVDAWEEPDSFYLLTGMCAGGELLDRIISAKGGAEAFSEKDAAAFTRMMLEALDFCHERNIVHRDIKPENFVFDSEAEDSNLRLIDFGCAKKVLDHEEVKDVAGSPYYVAPEVLMVDGDSPFESCIGPRSFIPRTGAVWKASDMWSIGVIVYLLVCGAVPFNSRKGHDDKEILLRSKYGEYTFTGKQKLTDSVKDFINKALAYDPYKRLTTKEALAHPWVKGHTASSKALGSDVTDNIAQFGKQCRLKKAVGRVLANRISDNDKKYLAELFEKFDVDKNGKLSKDEVAAMLKYIGDDAPAAVKLAQMDSNGDGGVDLEELEQAQAIGALGSNKIRKDEMRAAFKLFDKDGDGFVSADELTRLVEGLDGETAKQMIAEADGSGDGKIDFEEWLSAMQGLNIRPPR